MKTLIILTSVLVALAGCATKPEVKYITKTEVVTTVLSPPPVFTEPVARIKPPPIKKYVSADWGEKEKMLFDYISHLNSQLETMFIDRAAVEAWVKEQKLLQLEKDIK